MNRTTQVWLYWRSQSVLNTLKTVGNSVCIKNDHAVNWENSLQHIVVLIINTNSLAWQYGAVTALHGQCTSSTRVFLYICTHLHWVEIYNTLIHRSHSHKEMWVYYTLQQNISKNRLALYVSFIILRFTPTEQFNKYFFFMLCDLTSPYPLRINLTNNFCNFSNLHARGFRNAWTNTLINKFLHFSGLVSPTFQSRLWYSTGFSIASKCKIVFSYLNMT